MQCGRLCFGALLQEVTASGDELEKSLYSRMDGGLWDPSLLGHHEEPTQGQVRGPMHRCAKMLMELNIESEGTRRWKQGYGFVDLENIEDVKGFIRTTAVNRMLGNWPSKYTTSQG